MSEDRLQAQRFELKYVIDESVASRVREFVRSYLAIDEFGATMPNLSYPVHSLYLDSDSLKLYFGTVNGEKNRFKLRLRYYDEKPETPIFFEIKRRMNNTILKERGGVKREAVHHLLSGYLPEQSHLISRNPRHLFALQRFCHLMATLQAKPKAHVGYMREAWISTKDISVRVTMDRRVECEPDPMAVLPTAMKSPVNVFGSKVILELKFTDRFPDWFQDLVRACNLKLGGAAKYVGGVDLIGVEKMSRLSAGRLHVYSRPSASLQNPEHGHQKLPDPKPSASPAF
jgi:hypothetical protein